MSINIEGRNVPQPTYEYEVSRLVQSYKDTLVKIQGELMATDVTNLKKAQAYALQESIRKKLGELDSSALKWVNENIPNAAKDGVASSLVSLGLVADLEEAKKIAHFNQTNENLVKTAVAYTGKDVLAITQNMNINIQKGIRDIAAIALRENLTAGYGMRTIRNDMRQRINELQGELANTANVAIIDSAGRKWGVDSYTEMLARTTLHNVHTEAVTNDATDRGANYATISINPSTKDACKYHEGRIIKLDPNAEGSFMTYDELKATGQIFHPNCKHHLLPFRRFDRLNSHAQKVAEKQEAIGRAATQAGGRNPSEADVQKGRKEFANSFKPPMQHTQTKTLADAHTATTGVQKKATILENYKPTKNIKEANAWAAQHLPISKVDYKGYDIRLANEMNRQLALLLDTYEEVRNIKFIGTSQARNTGLYKEQIDTYVEALKKHPNNANFTDEQLLAFAKKKIKKRKVSGNNYASATNHTWGRWEGVTWNEAYAKDYDKITQALQRDEASKWHPINTAEPTSIITHEFGHMVDYYIQHGDKRVYNKEILPLLNEMRGKGSQYVIDNLSQYAYTNNAEMIAESFGEYYHSPNPRPLCIEIVEAVNKAYNIVRKSKGSV